MSRLIAAPSPKGTNHARMFLVQQRVPADRRGLAFDAGMLDGGRTGFAATRADLPTKEIGQDDETRIANLADFLRGKNLSEDDVRGAIERMLSAEGFSEDDVRQACDALGIGSSARFGGASTGSNFGGNLHEQVKQPSSSPPVKDRSLTFEEQSGCVPYAGRDARPRFGAARDSFEFVYGRQDRLAEIRAASTRRRPQSRNQVAMDSARAANFYERFPEARRIRGAI